MNFEISRLVVERNIAYNIWDKNKTAKNRNRFPELSKKEAKAVCASKQRSAKEYLNPKFPSKLLWRNLKNKGLKDDPDYVLIFTAEELNTYYYTLASLIFSISKKRVFQKSYPF
jgi:hypothetical protein